MSRVRCPGLFLMDKATRERGKRLWKEYEEMHQRYVKTIKKMAKQMLEEAKRDLNPKGRGV